MNREVWGGEGLGPPAAGEIKQCCARLYESEIVSRLLGDFYHSGGAALTERLGQLLRLTPESRVLDVASGKGTSAVLIAQRFGSAVVGIDLSAQNVRSATAEVDRLGLARLVRFEIGDAERLPIDDASVDAIICECAFCTFPDKPGAAREFARVLKPGGQVGLSDITRAYGADGELSDLMAWIACLADASSAEAYTGWLTGAGLTKPVVEIHDDALREMIRAIGTRLLAAEVMVGLGKLDLAGIDFAAAKRMTKQALTAVAGNRLGYAIIRATKPKRLASGQVR